MKIPIIMLVSSFFCSDSIAMEGSAPNQPEYYQNVEDYFHGLPGSSRKGKTAEICIIITEYDQKLKKSKKKN